MTPELWRELTALPGPVADFAWTGPLDPHAVSAGHTPLTHVLWMGEFAVIDQTTTLVLCRALLADAGLTPLTPQGKSILRAVPPGKLAAFLPLLLEAGFSLDSLDRSPMLDILEARKLTFRSTAAIRDDILTLLEAGVYPDPALPWGQAVRDSLDDPILQEDFGTVLDRLRVMDSERLKSHLGGVLPEAPENAVAPGLRTPRL
jgi:hypothetical protein